MKTGGKRERRRLRGAFSGKEGKALGISSISLPLLGFVVRDLRKPDSLIRRFIGSAATKLFDKRIKSGEVIDITDRVEVIEDKSDSEG